MSQSVMTNLQDVVSRFHVCYVDPLAVDVSVVGIVTSWAQPLAFTQHPHKHLIYKSHSWKQHFDVMV